MEELLVEAGVEVSDSSVKPPEFTDEKKQKLAALSSKYGVEMIRPPL
jgi:hypothetical protein